jgi:hypothetical protein
MIDDIWCTVKLGYNELGYNNSRLLQTNFPHFLSPKIHIYYIKEFRYNELLVIMNKFGQSQAVCYNQVWLYLCWMIW